MTTLLYKRYKFLLFSFSLLSLLQGSFATCGIGQRWTGTNCIEGLPGTFQNSTSHLSYACVNCPAGTFGNALGLTTSTCSGYCSAGTYSLGGTSSCTNCPAGRWGATTGLTSAACTGTCSAGKYADSGSTICLDCIDLNIWWMPNPTSRPGTNYCLDSESSCGQGKYLSGSLCNDCPPGTYQISSSFTGSSCPACPPGTSCAWSSVVICSVGTYSTSGSTSCTPCPAGTIGAFPGLTNAACSGTCGIGKYSLAGSSTCTYCPAGLTSPGGSTSSSACVTPSTSCSEGKYLTGSACVSCPSGTYQNSSSFSGSSCTSCPTGISTTDSTTGSISVSACTICAAGYAGTVTNSGTSNAAGCSICSVGSYSLANSSSCTSCPAGISTFTEGTYNIYLEAGSTSVQACRFCAPGYQGYVPWEVRGTINATGCTPCALGQYADVQNIFMTGCSSCPAGTFGSSIGLNSSSCSGTISCNVGTYAVSGATSNDTSSTTVCAQCPSGTNSTAGSTSISQCLCPAGTYYYWWNPHVCILCPSGYSSLLGSSSCFPIQTSCNQGQYLAGYNCVQCPAGTFQSLNQFSGSSCTNCTAGTYVSSTGASSSSSCSTCGYGTFSLSGASSCSIATPCGAGKRVVYGATSNTDACVDCEVGTYQSMTSHSSPDCFSCPAGTWGGTTGLTTSACSGTLTCPSGKYALTRAISNDINNSNSCGTCRGGHYSSAGSLICDLCAAGTYSLPGSTSCTACNTSSYSYRGSASCSRCSPDAIFISSTSGCAPATYPTDTAFYLSGTKHEGLSAFSSTTTRQPSYISDVFGVPNGAIDQSVNNYILNNYYAVANGSDALTSLPSGGNVAWSASAWVKCRSQANLFKWGPAVQNLMSVQNEAALSFVRTTSSITVSAQNLLSSSTSSGLGLAADRFGNIFLARPSSSSSISITLILDNNERSYYSILSMSSTIFKLSPPYASLTPLTGEVFSSVRGLTVDNSGNVFVADTNNHAVKQITPQGTVTTLATGFLYPQNVAVNDEGEVYVADTFNGAVKKILKNGTVTTLFSSRHPSSIAVDNSSNVYVLEELNGGSQIQLRKVTPGGVSSIVYNTNSIRPSSTTLTGNLITVDAASGFIFLGLPSHYIDSLTSPLILKFNPDGTLNSTLLSTEFFTSLTHLSGFAVLPSGQIIVNSNTLFQGAPPDNTGAGATLNIIHNRIHIPACDSTWHHVALTYEPRLSVMTAYIDGKLNISRSLWSPIILPSRSLSSLHVLTGSYLPFSFSDLRVYNRTITADEVQSLSGPSSVQFLDSKLDNKRQTPSPGMYWFSCALGYSGPLAVFTKSLLDNSYSWSISPSCSKCPAGSWATQGATSCSMCPPGTYSLDGASICTPCPNNTFNSKVGAADQIQCRPCPEGSSSLPGSSSCERVIQTLEPLSNPSSCQLKLFPSSDLSGDRLTDLATATEGDCSRACCKNATCLGYTYFRTLQSCTLLSNITYVVPSSFISGGVRDSALWL
jgi:hypothetical protein